MVYSYEELQKPKEGRLQSEKFMASAIRVGSAGQWNAGNMDRTLSDEVYVGYNFMATSEGSMVFSTGFLEPCASTGTKKKVYQRRRPPKSRRKPRPLLLADKTEGVMWDKSAYKSVVGSKKRKVQTEVGELLVSAKSKTPKVIPREGSSNA